MPVLHLLGAAGAITVFFLAYLRIPLRDEWPYWNELVLGALMAVVAAGTALAVALRRRPFPLR